MMETTIIIQTGEFVSKLFTSAQMKDQTDRTDPSDCTV